MRRKYSTVLLLLLAIQVAASPCPPVLEVTAAQVAALRGVSAPFLPPCRTISPAALSQELDAKLRRDLPLAPELFVEVLYRLNFFDAAPKRVYPQLLAFYSRQVLGFYEPAADEMVLVGSSSGPALLDTTIWAHELAHAAQERRFHLPTKLLSTKHSSDQQRAMSAIAEGDATLVMLVLGQAGTPALERLWQAQRQLAAQAKNLASPSGVPDFFVQDLVFPYAQGLATVLTAYEQGGWGAVDELLRQPPTSTAELLHPDRPPPRSLLSDQHLPPAPAGYTTVLTDTLGEWALAFWLGRRVPAQEAAKLAATWDGDRLWLGRNAEGEWGLTLLIRCRNAAECDALAGFWRIHSKALLARLSPRRQPQIHVTLADRLLTVQSAGALPSSPRR